MAKKNKEIPLLEAVLVDIFGLQMLYENNATLSDWLDANDMLEENELLLLRQAHAKLIRKMNVWNEEELKMQFISIVTHLAYFDDPIQTYYDREISTTIDTHFLKCKSDMMLSKGIGELIKTPYFFLHEYKREKRYSGDPIGQMLGGMLIGQAKNNNAKPMYGCYVQGRFWFFSVLEGQQYCISRAFDASDFEQAKKIIYILRKLKIIILERLMD